MHVVLTRRWAQRFITRVFSPEEVSACERSPNPAQCYAARFAAKEALVKAFGTGFSRGITPGMIFVRGGERNRPEINLKGKRSSLLNPRMYLQSTFFLTHTATSACAFVVGDGMKRLQANPFR